MGRRRHLQPGLVLPVGEHEVWVLDYFHPVAAVFDRATGAFHRLVSWADALPPSEGFRFAVRGQEVWLQPIPRGPLIRLTSAGLVCAHVVDQDYKLAAVGPDGAWSAREPAGQDLSDHRGVPPRRGPTGSDRVLLVTPADEHRWVNVPGRVRQVVRSWRGGVDIELDVAPWHRRALHDTPRVVDGVELGTWEAVWESAWVHLPDGFTGDRIDLEGHGVEAPGQRPRPGTVSTPGYFPVWHGDAVAVRYGPRVAGLAWVAGWLVSDGSLPDYQRNSVITGHDTVTGERRVLTELGVGKILGMTVEPEALLLLVSRKTAEVSVGFRGEVIRVDAATGKWASLTDLSEIPLAGHGWPLVTEPVEAPSHERVCLQDWSRVGAYWHGKDGDRPLAGGLTDAHAQLVGSWPETRVELSFAFDRRPGRRLVHRQDLYDELGRPRPTGYSPIHLMENLETGLRQHHIGPAGELLL